MRQAIVPILVCIFLLPSVTAVLAEDIPTPPVGGIIPYAVTVPPPEVQADIKHISDQVSSEYLHQFNSKLQGFGSRFYNSQGNVNCVQWLNDTGTGMGRVKVSYHNWTIYSTMLGRLVTATNVIYTIPGLNTSSDRVYYYYAHMDSSQYEDYNQVRQRAPGADDDGSGTAAGIEIARVLGRYDFHDTIKIAFFNGEEIGLYGSKYYMYNSSQIWHENVQGGIDYDMVGLSPGNTVYDMTLESNANSAWERTYLSGVNDRYDIGLRIEEVQNGGSIPSDIAEFYRWGMPSVIGHEYNWFSNSYIHTFSDTMDKINITLERRSTQLAVAALAEMSRLIYVDAAIDQSNLTVSDTTPAEDDMVLVTANITNRGNVNATNMEVVFSVDGFPIDTKRIWVPADGKNTTTTIWKATTGNHIISVALDPKNEIVETDETNNTAYVTVGVNDRPRAILMAQPFTILTNETVTFNGSQSSDLVGGIEDYNFTYGDGSGSGWTTSPSVTHKYPFDGIYTASLLVRDVDGAQSLRSNVTIKVLNRAPWASPSSNVTRALTFVPIRFLSNATDLDGTVSVHWDLGDGCQTVEADPVHSYSKAGTYNIVLDIEDNDKATASYQLRVLVDDRGPTVSIDAETLTGDITTDLTFKANASDPDGTIVSYDWEFGDGLIGSTQQVSHKYLIPGNYTLRLTVRDDDGSVAWTMAHVRIIDTPPEAFADVSALESITFKALDFEGSESTDLEGTLTYLWDFGDGNHSTDADPTHAYWRPGKYDVTLIVKDSAGQTDVATLDPIEVLNRLPKAEFRHFGNYTLNNTVYFDATNSSDPEGAVTYHWSFGDGQEGTGPVPGHRFPSIGTYTINLTVTDQDGATAKATKTVTIVAPPPPPPPPKTPKPKDNSGMVNMLTLLLIVLIIIIVVLIIALAISRKKRSEPSYPGPPPPLTLPPPVASAPTTEAPPAEKGPQYPEGPDGPKDAPETKTDSEAPPPGPPAKQ